MDEKPQELLPEKSKTHELRAFLFCEFHIQDKNNRFSIMNIFDQINFKTLPSQYPVRIFAQVFTTPGTHKFEIKIENPSKASELMVEIPSEVGNVGENGLYTIMLEGLLSFDHYGIQYYGLYVDGELAGRSSLTIIEPKNK